MYSINAEIYSIDFFGEKVGEPLKVVSGDFESEMEALEKISNDFSLEYKENFRVEIVLAIPIG
jgi:hypothetical protein